MAYAPGQTFYAEQTTQSFSTGNAQNASATTISFIHNNSADGSVTVTQTNPSTGLYAFTGTVPSTYSSGDTIALLFTATVGGVTSSIVIPLGTVGTNVAAGTRVVNQDFGGTGALTVEMQGTGNPIQGATVTAYLTSAYTSNPLTAAAIAWTTTDINGNWTMFLYPASYTLTFASSGDQSTSTTITVT